MSVSKFESLPNEILIEIFEKYTDELDLIVAFGDHLNQRITALVAECRRLRLDFIGCHKNDFDRCIRFLPAYVDQIEDLFLSEKNTPGQVHAFLSFFPSFAPFKQLHKLYININAGTIDRLMVERALHSLLETSLEILSLIITNAWETNLLDNIVVDIFHLTTLKQLYLSVNSFRIQWNHLSNIVSNIEYLTILDNMLGFNDFETIFQCTPCLKYFRTQVNNYLRLTPPQAGNSPNNIIKMTKLRTLILTLVINRPSTFSLLAECFKTMPSLRRLQINANHALSPDNIWETLLAKSLPSLLYFDYNISTSHANNTAMLSALASFQTPFWIEKRNFNITAMTYSSLNYGRFLINRFDQPEFNLLVTRWWIAPLRGLDDNFAPLNNITTLNLSAASKPLPRYYHFNSIKYLIVRDLDVDLLNWIFTYINCSQIEILDVSSLENESITIGPLLLRVKNITTLRITFNELFFHQHAFRGRDVRLKYLNISAIQHRFDETDIVNLSTLFSNVEHLVINTQSLHNIPLLEKYLPRLRSLKFEISDSTSLRTGHDYLSKIWDGRVKQNMQFSFHYEANSITVWLA
jgi:hypothetical protein